MNDTLIFIYLVFFVALFAATFAYMFKMMTSTLSEMDKKPVKSFGDAMKPYKAVSYTHLTLPTNREV